MHPNDDEPNLVDLVRGYLQHEVFEVAVAADGSLAVEAARAVQPDLIVMDLMLLVSTVSRCAAAFGISATPTC